MKIEKGVPLPTYRPRTTAGLTAKQMMPGDSVLCDDENTARNLRYAIYTAKGKASVRKVENGWRVWRTA